MFSNRYELKPQAVIMAEFVNKPFGGFYVENENLLGFCNIPWDAVTSYTSNNYDDIEATMIFAEQWDCSYK